MIKDLYNTLKVSKILLPIILVINFSSCSKSWLDEKPDKKQAIPETVADFQAMLDNFTIISQASTPSFGEIAADGHFYTDAIFTAMAPTYTEFQNAYCWNDRQPYVEISSWETPYTAIAYMNIILDQISKKKDQVEFNDVKGQALFHRGYFFYSLAQLFAPPYTKDSAHNSLGIALRLSTDITEVSKRASLEETYQRILKDLHVAKDLLPVSPLFLSRGSKIACLGLLARVYLTMNDYENALIYANEYLNAKNGLLQYSTLSTSADFIGSNDEIAYLRLLPSNTQLNSIYFISQDLLDLYKVGDIRKNVFFKTNAAGTIFKGSYGSTATNMFAGIATDEIYLIKAECLARKGDLSNAMINLNDLVRSRWEKNVNGSTKYIDQSALNETDALRIIFEERRKQLILRNVRWTDLRRYNLDDRFKTTLVRTVMGETYTLDPKSFRYTFPIPQDIIAVTGMQQNIHW